MGLFSIFKKKKPNDGSDAQNNTEQVLVEFQNSNFLGKAADAGHKAKAAVNAKQYNEAWYLYHQQKDFYMQHANFSEFTVQQSLALDSQVHEDLANILRIEGKNHDALVHILYWVIANNQRPIKRHEQKLSAYFGRCNFKETSLAEAISFVTSSEVEHPFLSARSKVLEWKSRGSGN